MIRGRQREIGPPLPSILAAAFPGKKWLVILLLYKNLDTKRDRLRHKYAKGGSETKPTKAESVWLAACHGVAQRVLVLVVQCCCVQNPNL